MGRVVLVGRLAARDLRRRPGEAALLLLAIMAATTVLTLGLLLRGVISKPYETTREATAGPDVVAAGVPDRLKTLTDARGVVGHSGPYPVVAAIMEANGRTVVTQTEGRDAAAAPVDQPKPTAGGWVRDGGAVIEAAFADALGIAPGDRVTLKPMRNGGTTRGPGRWFEVAGVAVTAATPPYPEPACLANLCQGGDDTGLVWLTKADALGLDAQGDPLYILNLRLADPAAAPAFAADRNPGTESAHAAAAVAAHP